MKKYIDKIDNTPRHYQELIERSCDLCGFKARNEDWGAGYYDINETECKVEIRHKKGKNYPDGGNYTEFEVDICPKCFNNKLIPWLKSQGVNIQEKDVDW